MDVEIVGSPQRIRESYLSKEYEETSLTHALYEGFITFTNIYKYRSLDKFDVASLIYIFFIVLFGCLSLYYLVKITCGGKSRNRVLKKKSE